MKNKNCRLIRELKQYHETNRLLITGTPLQNNITELWSLLNYLMPDIFSDVQNFESIFDFSSITDKNADKEQLIKQRKSKFVVALHEILRPFLLRRVKTDVESDLPKKREYILYAPLTPPQKELYQQIVKGTSRAFLEQQVVDRISQEASVTSSRSSSLSLKRKAVSGVSTPNKSAKSSRASTPASVRSTKSGARSKKRKNYKETDNDDQLSDDKFLKALQDSSESEDLDEEELDKQELAKTIQLASSFPSLPISREEMD
jgi:ATP-dependent DNA helicase